MNFSQAVISGFKNSFNFSSRAARSEYWYWVLFGFLAGILTAVLDMMFFGMNGPQIISNVFSVITIIPGLAVGVRRLHDVNKSGWWTLIALTIIGIIPLLYWASQKGTEGENRFGADPLGIKPIEPFDIA